MKLFDDIKRRDIHPRRPTQASFPWLNESTRRQAHRVRAVLESWFADLPPDARADLHARFRSRDTYQHLGAFFELYCHTLLRRQGYLAQLHQTRGDKGTRRPDFEVLKDRKPCFVLESTIAAPSSEDQAAEARLNQLYEALNSLDSPNFFLGIRVRAAPVRSIRGSRIRAFVHSHLAGLDPDEALRLLQGRGIGSIPHWRYQDDGADIVIFPIPKSPAARGKPGIRPVGAQMEGVKWVDSGAALRRALESKASRYGNLGIPYVIAVDGVDEWDFPADDFEMEQTLLGTRGCQLRVNVRTKQPEVVETQRPDGFWFGPQGPRNKRVSAVLIGSIIVPFSIGRIAPVLWHNPWADRPLDLGIWAGPQVSLHLQSGEYKRVEGKSVWELLGLYQGWPHDRGKLGGGS